jgi:hypothetical protein
VSLPPWATGVPSRDLPLLGALGSREQLLETFRRETDPVLRATVLRALVALEVGERRAGFDSGSLAKLLETCAADGREPDVVRGAAAIGLPFVSMDRAKEALPELLESSPPVRARAIDLLEAVTFLEKSSATAVSVELRAVLVKHVAVRVSDPATSPEDRKRGQALLLFSA